MSGEGTIAATPPAAKSRRRCSPSPHRPVTGDSEAASFGNEAGSCLWTPREKSSSQLQPESALKAPRPQVAARNLSHTGALEPSTPKRRPGGNGSGSGSGTWEASTPGIDPRVILRRVDLADSKEIHQNAAAGALEPLREAVERLLERMGEEEKSCGGTSARGAKLLPEEATTHAILAESLPSNRPLGLLAIATGSCARPHAVPGNAAELPVELRERAAAAPEVVPILKKMWIEPSHRRQGFAKEALRQAFADHEHLVVEAPVAAIAQTLEALGWVLCGSRWASGRSFLCRYIRQTPLS